MPGQIPVLIHIEDLPFAKILRQLHDTQGIVEVAVLLGQGGGKSVLTEAEIEAARANGTSLQAKVIAALAARGPMGVSDVAEAIDGRKSSVHGAMNALGKKGIVKNVDRKWHLIARPPTNGATPPQVAHTAGGRARPGQGSALLLAMLRDGAKALAELRTSAAAAGVSAKSVKGMVDRARNAGFIRRSGGKGRKGQYMLTARGEKQVAAHG